MSKRINKLISIALEAAEKHLEKDGKIEKEYNGYISSFGAAVIQSGLKAAVAFNESESSGSAKDRKKLMKAILHILKKGQMNDGDNDKLMNYVLENDNPATKSDIMDAAAALKLAIRTFKLEKNEED